MVQTGRIMHNHYLPIQNTHGFDSRRTLVICRDAAIHEQHSAVVRVGSKCAGAGALPICDRFAIVGFRDSFIFELERGEAGGGYLLFR